MQATKFHNIEGTPAFVCRIKWDLPTTPIPVWMQVTAPFVPESEGGKVPAEVPNPGIRMIQHEMLFTTGITIGIGKNSDPIDPVRWVAIINEPPFSEDNPCSRKEVKKVMAHFPF